MATLKVNSKVGRIGEALDRLARVDGEALLGDIGESLLLSTEARFDTERDPDGQPWKPLAPATLKRKRNSHILTESTRLRSRIVRQVRGGELRIGTNLKYAAIHQFGGTVEQPARKQTLYFKQDRKTGLAGNRFVKRKQSNFAQEAEVGEREFEVPARPYLGISAGDRKTIKEIIRAHVDAALDGD